MQEICDQKLIEWGKRGIIPGPLESHDAFLERANALSSLTEAQPQETEKLHDLFLVKPDWIKVEYSNKGLLPWQGGCVMVEENSVFMQIRKSYQKKKKLWWIYKKEEIIAHELVHVARSTFEEPIFEEILAYQTSSSKVRRYLGPLFRSSKESIIFLTVLLGLSCVNLLYTLPLTLVTGSLGMVTLFLFRLNRNHKTFQKVLRKWEKLVACKKKALSCLLRLTDREIMLFAGQSPDEILSYIEKEKEKNLRLRQLYLIAFAPTSRAKP